MDCRTGLTRFTPTVNGGILSLNQDSIDGELRPATDEEIPDPPTEPTVPDSEELERGDAYDGPNKGFEFSVDADGKPFKETRDGRQYIEADDYHDVAAYVRRQKGGGTVVVNEANHAVTYLGDEWLFVDVISDPCDIEYTEQNTKGLIEEADFGLDDFDVAYQDCQFRVTWSLRRTSGPAPRRAVRALYRPPRQVPKGRRLSVPRA